MESSSRPQTLTLNKEFKRAYYQGRSKASPFFVCYVVKNRGRGVRYGITTSKKLGNAVARNRARRVIRAAFFSILAWTEPNRDYVFVARERVLSAKSYQAAAAMKGCLKALKEGQGQKPKAQGVSAGKR
ncbi:MAG: ribonuclease P protein component [Oscillospiraceae bacterium]|jgi:ribonuclease P protein component|nr:ribonuclease P protein component [Oscillospiraceae bacterium]